MSSKASSDPVDLEKGVVTGLRKEEEEQQLSVVNPRKAMCIKLFFDASALLNVLFFVGLMVWAIMVSNTWWDPLPPLLILSPILGCTLWLTPMMKEVCIQRYATESTLGSDDSDLSTKLLAPSSDKK